MHDSTRCHTLLTAILVGLSYTHPPEVVIWEDALLGNSEYSVRVMGLVSFLLHCNASNLVLEILKHGNIWGTICIGVPSLQIMGDSFPLVSHDLRPCILRLVIHTCL